MYKVILNEDGEMTTFCLSEDAIFDDVTYYDAPEGFDPTIHSCMLDEDGKLVLTDLVLPEIPAIDKTRGFFSTNVAVGLNLTGSKGAQTYIDYKASKIAFSEYLAIQEALRPVNYWLDKGDWLSAQAVMKNVIPQTSYQTSLFTKITGEIADYIRINY